MVKEEKKLENYRVYFLNLVIKEKYVLFFFKMYFIEKKCYGGYFGNIFMVNYSILFGLLKMFC